MLVLFTPPLTLTRLRKRQVGTWGTNLTIGARRGRAARGSPGGAR